MEQILFSLVWERAIKYIWVYKEPLFMVALPVVTFLERQENLLKRTVIIHCIRHSFSQLLPLYSRQSLKKGTLQMRLQCIFGTVRKNREHTDRGSSCFFAQRNTKLHQTLQQQQHWKHHNNSLEKTKGRYFPVVHAQLPRPTPSVVRTPIRAFPFVRKKKSVRIHNTSTLHSSSYWNMYVWVSVSVIEP